MKTPNCNLESWEAAQCPKLGPICEQIVEKITEVDSLLSEWASESGLCHECRMKILGILNLVNDIPPMLGDLGLPYVKAMEHHQEMLEALKVPELPPAGLAGIKELSRDC